MNAWILFAVILGIIYLTGLLMLVSCALWAPEGYEDEQGFRLGRQPAAPPQVNDSLERALPDSFEQAA